MFKQAHFLDMAEQALAGRSGRAGLAAHDQDGAQAILQQLDALGHRRWGDADFAGGFFEAAGADNPGHGVEKGVIEHDKNF